MSLAAAVDAVSTWRSEKNHSHSIIHSPLHASVHWGGSDFEVLYTVKDTVKTRGLR